MLTAFHILHISDLNVIGSSSDSTLVVDFVLQVTSMMTLASQCQFQSQAKIYSNKVYLLEGDFCLILSLVV